ncbi:MAG: hypothetical protein ACPH3N_03600 [Alcanivorax sediminis]|uniref:hypothetical protein n=1 Tax=Alcanivorax sediminis TaxID=2663008 RepID=UPI003C3241B4
MTTKLWAAATLMLVTTASAWADSAEEVAISQAAFAEPMELRQDADAEMRNDGKDITPGMGDLKQ